jgi:hypothetical protein
VPQTFSLQYFGEILKHVIGGTILDLQVSTIDAVLDVIEQDIDVPCSLTGALRSVPFQQHGRGVVLVDGCFTRRVVESMGLKVQLPMRIEIDSKGAVDLASWTATNSTRHIATRINFLRELKAHRTVSVVWISNQFMSSDIFTKNVGGQSFVRHRDVTINIVLTIIVMAGFRAEVVDVKRAFLTAEFDPKHTLYGTVPQGLEKYYPGKCGAVQT